FENVDKTGFENFNSFEVEEELVATIGYQQFTCDGLWNGTGDFKLSFTGEIYLYMLVMSTDKVEALTYKYRTLFEQSEKLIRLSAQNFDKDGNVLAESSITQTAESIALKVKQDLTDGLLATGIDIIDGEVGITADKVRFTDNEGNVQMLLEDGKINADALNVKDIESGRVVVRQQDNPLQRVEILPEEQGMIIYNEKGDICQEFTGQTKENGVSDFFGNDDSGELAMVNANGSERVNATSDTTVNKNVETVVSEVWDSVTPSTLKMLAGNIRVYAYSAGYTVTSNGSTQLQPIANSYASAYGNLVLQEFEDAACTKRITERSIAYLSVSASSSAKMATSYDYDNGALTTPDNPGTGSLTPSTGLGGSGNKTTTYSADSKGDSADVANKSIKTLNSGYFRLLFRGVLSAAKNGSYATLAWGSEVQGGKDFKAEWKNDNYVSYHFANGFCMGTKSDDYFIVYRTSSGMNFECRNPNYGIRVLSDGIQTLVANKLWVSLPVLLCKCIYTYDKSASTPYNATQITSFDGRAPAAVRTGTGVIRLDFPDTWKDSLADRLTAAKLLVHVYGYHQTVKAAIASITNTSITIGLSDDHSTNDANFMIDIQLI
ncbi:MAG: hypothetical protein NC131_22245, partial [Roseburia sp.]|nr:hypothetical protein [Roseburia sp.]